MSCDIVSGIADGGDYLHNSPSEAQKFNVVQLLTAHNRPRLYWTNIPNVGQPNDNGIYFEQIRDLQIENYEYISEEKIINREYKKNYLQYDINGKGHGSQDQRAYYLKGKHGCLDTGASGKAKVLYSFIIMIDFY